MTDPDIASIEPAFDITLEFRDQARAVFRDWESRNISYEEAFFRLEKMRDQAATRDNPADIGYAETQIGIVHGYRGNYNASITHLERARDLYLDAKNRRLVISATINIGETYRLKGNFARARQFFHTGHDAALEIGNRVLQVLARSNESLMLITQGRSDLAEVWLNECYAMCETPLEEPETPDIYKRRMIQRCEISEAMATIYIQTDRLDAALQKAMEAVNLAHEINSSTRRGFANRVLGEVLTYMDTPVDGLDSDPDSYFQASLDSFREIDAEAEIARTLLVQGKSMGQRGKIGGATRRLQQAVTMFTRLGMVDDAAKAAEAQLNML